MTRYGALAYSSFEIENDNVARDGELRMNQDDILSNSCRLYSLSLSLQQSHPWWLCGAYAWDDDAMSEAFGVCLSRPRQPARL